MNERKDPAAMTVPLKFERIAFVASPSPDAQEALAHFTSLYGACPPEEADIIVALGGDGLMLQTLHNNMRSNRPIYGMHRGTVGFLMNEFCANGLRDRLEAAEVTVINPLLMRATDIHGRIFVHHAINEVALFRQTHQAARLRILIDGRERMAELIADGVMVATPAGSPAYNLTAQGPILPLNAAMLAASTAPRSRSLRPITTRPATWCASRFCPTRASPCACCSTLATASKSAFSASSSAIRAVPSGACLGRRDALTIR